MVDHILVKHFKTHAYKCDECDTTFVSPKPWKDHMRSNCDRQTLTEVGKFVCKKCKQRFEAKAELFTHVEVQGYAKYCVTKVLPSFPAHGHIFFAHIFYSPSPPAPPPIDFFPVFGYFYYYSASPSRHMGIYFSLIFRGV